MKLDMNDIINVLIALIIFELAKKFFLNDLIEKI
jgi:hypothetical protein